MSTPKSTLKIDILPAQAADADTILALQKMAYATEAALHNDPHIPPLTQTIAALRLEFTHKHVIKAQLDGHLIGSGRAEQLGDTAHIGRLMVAPAWQGQGIGTRLLQALEAHFDTATRFELFTGEHSEQNIRLYEKHGYRRFKTGKAGQTTVIYFEKRRTTGA